MSRDLVDGRHHVGQVRVPGLSQRCGHADVNGVNLCQLGEIVRSVQLTGFGHRQHFVVWHISDI